MTPESPRHEGEAIDQARQDWEALAGVGEMFPGTALAESSEQLRHGGQWPENLGGTPIVIDAASSPWDAGVALAVTAAARSVPEFALILVGDESAGSSAHRLLGGAGRSDVTVAVQPGDVPSVVRAACGTGGQPIRWVSVGQPRCLARVVEQAPELAGRLRVTQTWTSSEEPAGTEAARTVLDAVREERLRALELVSVESPEGTPAIDGSRRRAMALAEALEGSFDRSAPAAVLTASIALSAALALPFFDDDRAGTEVDEDGRFQRRGDGVPLWWATVDDYDPLVGWLTRAVAPVEPSSSPLRPGQGK